MKTMLKVAPVNCSGMWAVKATIRMTILALMPAMRPAIKLASMTTPIILSFACCDMLTSLVCGSENTPHFYLEYTLFTLVRLREVQVRGIMTGRPRMWLPHCLSEELQSRRVSPG